MMSFFAELRVKSGKEAEFERLQQELSRQTHASEPDAIVYDVVRHRDRPGIYGVYARFTSDEAFAAHLEMPFHHELVPAIMDCLEGAEQGMKLDMYDWVG